MARALRNTVQRNRTFHFRRAIPRNLRPLFGRSELTCSLRTSELRVAELRSRQLYLASEALFLDCHRLAMLSDDQLAPIVQDFYAHVLQQENRVRLRLGPIPEEARLKRASYFKEVAEHTRTDLACNDFANVALVASAMMRKRDLENSLDEDEKRQVKQALLRGGIDLAEALRARYEGDFNYEPRDKLLKTKVEALFSIPPTSPPQEEKPTSNSDAPLFSKAAAVFVKKQKDLHRWENQTAAQNEKSYELFAAVCGDHPFVNYSKKDAAKFKDVLERLPAIYGKAAIYHGKSPEEILEIDAANGGSTDRLSIRTVKRHISALSALWDELVPSGEAAHNIFTGFKFPQQQRAQDQRPMWTRGDLTKLFTTPIWTGCRSVHRRSQPGTEIIRDDKLSMITETGPRICVEEGPLCGTARRVALAAA